MGSRRRKPKPGLAAPPPAAPPPVAPSDERRSRRHSVSIDRQASKALLRLPAIAQLQIGARIDALKADARPLGSQKLKGQDNLHRIRFGDYRVIYAIRDDQILVLVVRIGDRKDIYRDL